MATVTLTFPDKTKAELKTFNWVNWSLTAITKFKMKSLFEKYMKKIEFSAEDNKFCELLDWHPVDELPMKEEYIKELLKASNEPSTPMTSNELDKLMGLG